MHEDGERKQVCKVGRPVDFNERKLPIFCLLALGCFQLSFKMCVLCLPNLHVLTCIDLFVVVSGG